MAETSRRRLIIDADVAAAKHPTGRCRRFLEGVLEICHHIVFTRELHCEWRNHASPVVRTWLRSMWARKKVDTLPAISNQVLRDKIQRCFTEARAIEAVLKDMHLIEAAMATDGLVVSRDTTARQQFAQAASVVAELRNLVWVNPQEEDDPRLWLQRGAKAEKGRMLGRCGK